MAARVTIDEKATETWTANAAPDEIPETVTELRLRLAIVGSGPGGASPSGDVDDAAWTVVFPWPPACCGKEGGCLRTKATAWAASR